jgi:hypothetical protein
MSIAILEIGTNLSSNSERINDTECRVRGLVPHLSTCDQLTTSLSAFDSISSSSGLSSRGLVLSKKIDEHSLMISNARS